MPTRSAYVCTDCHRFMVIKRNGVTVEELMDDGAPYKLWDADLYECPNCGVQIATGFAQAPLAEHFQPTYDRMRERLAPIIPAK